MCLGTKLSDRFLARYKAKGKKCGYIRVYKNVNKLKGKGGYVSDYEGHCYKAGFNPADKCAEEEQELIHAFRNRTGWNWATFVDECVISCMVKPEWIMAISGEALTTKAIVMPKYPKTKVTVAEFRAAIKGKKVKTYKWE